MVVVLLNMILRLLACRLLRLMVNVLFVLMR